MSKMNGSEDIDKTKHSQILKLVTNSFYRELVNYGVNSSDLITVSVNLLDFVTSHQNKTSESNGYYNRIFQVNEVGNTWEQEKSLTFGDVSIKPLEAKYVPQMCQWLNSPDIENTFISFMPKEIPVLEKYLLEREDRQYFGIFYFQDNFVGMIGAENIDHAFRKAEMKKFVGAKEYRSKGIGKLATFLFLYYIFMIMHFNKVYIYSLDTNIQNINLNSKFGFELEGILYKEARLRDAYRDVLRMGLLRSTWLDIFTKQEKD